MNKMILRGIFILSLLFFLSACGGSKEEPKPEQPVFDLEYIVDVKTDGDIQMTYVMASVLSKIYRDEKLVASGLYNEEDSKVIKSNYKTTFRTKSKGASFSFIVKSKQPEKETHCTVTITAYQNKKIALKLKKDFTLTEVESFQASSQANLPIAE